MSLRKNLFKNGIASGLQKTVRVFDQLLLVPIFIAGWGTEYYGEWLTLTIVPSVLAFSDLGFGSAAANKFVLEYASGDKQKAANTSKSAVLVISMLILSGVVLSAVAFGFLNHFGVFERLAIPKSEAMLAVAFMMLARLLSFYQQLFEAYFRAARKAALSINLLTGYAVVQVITNVAVLTLGGRVVALSLATLLTSALFYLFYSQRAIYLLKLNKSHIGQIHRADIKSIFSNGLGYLMSPTWQALYFQGTTFVVRVLLGPQAVAVFNTVRTVSRSVNQAYGLINNSVFPELQYEIGAGNLGKSRKLFRTAIGLTLVTSVFGMIMLYLFGPALYSFWTRNTLNPPVAMWNFFLIGIAFNAVWWTAGVVFRAVNKPYHLALPGLIGAAISVSASYVLTASYGLTGAAIGSVSMDILMAMYVLPVSCRLIGERLNELPQKTWKDLGNLRKEGLGVARNYLNIKTS